MPSFYRTRTTLRSESSGEGEEEERGRDASLTSTLLPGPLRFCFNLQRHRNLHLQFLLPRRRGSGIGSDAERRAEYEVDECGESRSVLLVPFYRLDADSNLPWVHSSLVIFSGRRSHSRSYDGWSGSDVGDGQEVCQGSSIPSSFFFPFSVLDRIDFQLLLTSASLVVSSLPDSHQGSFPRRVVELHSCSLPFAADSFFSQRLRT